MKFSDVFRKSFLKGYSTVELSTTQIIIVMVLTLLIGLYIFYCYRILTRKSFYSKSFNISLVAVAVITAAIILTIQSSVVVSLGMVGALSIVRFRTAIKDPMDLVFLFWAISVGIICGAGLVEIAVLASLVITFVLFTLDRVPNVKVPMILIVNGDYSDELRDKISEIVRNNSAYSKMKACAVQNDRMEMTFELRTKNMEHIISEIHTLQGVSAVNMLDHDGDITY